MSTQTEELEVKDPQGVLLENKRLQDERKALVAEIAELKEQVAGIEDDRFKLLAMRQEAVNAFQAEGLKDPERFLKLLDLESVEYDEESEKFTGLNDQIDALKKEWPEYFDKKKRASANSADIHATNPANVQRSTTEQQVDAFWANR